MSALRPRRGKAPTAGGDHAFIGFGALGRQLAGLFLRPAELRRAIFFDDVLAAAGRAGAVPFERWPEEEFGRCRFVLALGYRHLELRHRIAGELLARGRQLPSLVHGRAWVEPTATVGPGAVVYPMGNVDQGATLEAGALLHNSVVVSHDSVVGSGCYLSPGVVLCGAVRLGERGFLGAGSVVANGVSVGADARLGIGTVATRDVAAGASVIGNPMRVLDRPLTLH